MATETTYTSLRENLASILDQVVDEQETVIVRRRGARDVALVPARELAGLMETAHLLRSPENSRRLMSALHRAEREKTKPSTVTELRREILWGSGPAMRLNWVLLPREGGRASFYGVLTSAGCFLAGFAGVEAAACRSRAAVKSDWILASSAGLIACSSRSGGRSCTGK